MYSRPPSPVVSLSKVFSHSSSTTVQKQMMLLLIYPQKVHSNLMLCHNASVIHLTSSYHIGISCSHIIIRRRVSTLQDMLRGSDHIHITSTAMHYYNYSILLLVSIVNFSLCSIYRSNFIICINFIYLVKKRRIYKFSTITSFRHLLGVLWIFSVDNGGLLYFIL